MAEDDEGRRGSGAAVVLLNELVSLKFPYTVCVVLHFLESEAAAARSRVCLKFTSTVERTKKREDLLEDGDQKVEQKYIGEEEVNAQHDDGEPLREGRGLVLIQHRTFGLQGVGAVHAAGVQVKF